jgi:3-dehydroquinate synthase
MKAMIAKCAELHLEHIASSGDPFESGSARPLDFGHWAAHKLEMMTDGSIRHGEAVAAGLILDSFYAVKTGLIGSDLLEKLTDSLIALGFTLYYPEMTAESSGGTRILLEGIDEFREHLGGELHITLPKGLGRKTEVSRMDHSIIREGINYLAHVTGIK